MYRKLVLRCFEIRGFVEKDSDVLGEKKKCLNWLRASKLQETIRTAHPNYHTSLFTFSPLRKMEVRHNGDVSELAPSSTVTLPAATPATYYRRLNSQRFTIELEFLSSLASPSYLVHLHSQGYFQQASFIRYLAYLHQTWSQPNYIKYLRYPYAIVMCQALVENPDFRNIVGRDGWEAEVTKQMIRQWAGERENSTADAAALEGQDAVKIGNNGESAIAEAGKTIEVKAEEEI